MTCTHTGKIAQETRQAAQQVRIQIERRSGWRMNIYPCDHCGGFHLGRDMVKNAMRRERRRA